MTRLFLFAYICLVISCNTKNDRLIRRQIREGEVVLSWYFYSYITSGSPDFITLEKEGEEKEIYKGSRIITDVRLYNKSIIIKVIKPPKEFVDIKNIGKQVFGYTIFIDSSGTYEDLLQIPDGMKK